MSTLTFNKPSKLKLGKNKNSNKLRGPKKMRNTRTARNTRMRSAKAKGDSNAMGFVNRVFVASLVISALAFLSTGLLYGYRWVTANPYFALKDIAVNGNSRLSNGHVLELADVSLGTNSLEMNLNKVEQRLSDNPWVKSAAVRRELPGRLVINVDEKVPGFWMRQGAGVYFADSHGKVIAPVHPGEVATLPFLELSDGMSPNDANLSSLLDMIGNKSMPFDLSQVAWVKVLGSKQVEIFLDGQKLALRMDLNGWQTQFRRIKNVWRDLARRGEFSGTAVIAATGDKVWVKRRGQGTAS